MIKFVIKIGCWVQARILGPQMGQYSLFGLQASLTPRNQIAFSRDFSDRYSTDHYQHRLWGIAAAPAVTSFPAPDGMHSTYLSPLSQDETFLAGK